MEASLRSLLTRFEMESTRQAYMLRGRGVSPRDTENILINRVLGRIEGPGAPIFIAEESWEATRRSPLGLSHPTAQRVHAVMRVVSALRAEGVSIENALENVLSRLQGRPRHIVGPGSVVESMAPQASLPCPVTAELPSRPSSFDQCDETVSATGRIDAISLAQTGLTAGASHKSHPRADYSQSQLSSPPPPLRTDRSSSSSRMPAQLSLPGNPAHGITDTSLPSDRASARKNSGSSSTGQHYNDGQSGGAKSSSYSYSYSSSYSSSSTSVSLYEVHWADAAVEALCSAPCSAAAGVALDDMRYRHCGGEGGSAGVEPEVVEAEVDVESVVERSSMYTVRYRQVHSASPGRVLEDMDGSQSHTNTESESGCKIYIYIESTAGAKSAPVPLDQLTAASRIGALGTGSTRASKSARRVGAVGVAEGEHEYVDGNGLAADTTCSSDRIRTVVESGGAKRRRVAATSTKTKTKPGVEAKTKPKSKTRARLPKTGAKRPAAEFARRASATEQIDM